MISNDEESLALDRENTISDEYDENQEFVQVPLQHAETLRDNVSIAMSNYFSALGGQAVTDVYQMVLSEVEAPLLEEVMKYCRNNQTKASVLLGLNRGTLRNKLKMYGLL
jgi:Fis family transcriptional regulator